MSGMSMRNFSMVKSEIKVATRFEKEEILTNRVKVKKRIHKRFQSTMMKKMAR